MLQIAFSLAIVFSAPAADGNALNKELKKLEGSWQFAVPEGERGRPFTWEVTGKNWAVVWSDKEKLPGKLTVYPGTSPACIDLLLENGTFIEGIYKIEGDTLTLRIGEANVKQRPTEFAKDDAVKDKTIILKRVKP